MVSLFLRWMLLPASEESDMTNRKGFGGLNVDHRGALACMISAGTGVLWTLSEGIPRSVSLLGEAQAASAGFTFLQISDGHVGSDKPADPN